MTVRLTDRPTRRPAVDDGYMTVLRGELPALPPPRMADPRDPQLLARVAEALARL